jgi:hypothetical protein
VVCGMLEIFEVTQRNANDKGVIETLYMKADSTSEKKEKKKIH